MKSSMKLAFLPAMMLMIGLTTCIQKSQAGKDYSVKPYCESPETKIGNTDKIKVLIVTGGHPFDREEFFALFQGYDDIEYEEFELKDESEVFEDVSSLDCDVMVLYIMTQEISQKRRDNFVRLLKEKGIGLVVVHHAEAAYQSWLEYHKIIGTAYIYTDVMIDGKLWLPHCTNKIGMDIPVYVRDNKHPITRGLKDFHIKEETYKGRWWAKDNHILLTTDHPDNDEPLAWTRQYGRSRVFNVQFGHDKEGFASPEFQELLVRGIRWTAGVKQSSDFSPRNNGMKSASVDGETVKDADGNIYHTVKIGNQLWTVENLKTTRYNDGTPIPNVTDDEGWKSLTTPGYCYYENNPENGKKYGVLYNWYAASSDKIAPKGWRLPTHDDQITLRDYLIANGYNYDGTTVENKVAKSMAAKTDWIYKATNEGGGPVSDIGTVGNNPETNNRSGFSALPTGSRWNDGSFHAIGTSVYWWSTTPDTAINKAHMSSVHTWYAKYGNNQHHKRSGFCIRLVRDMDVKEDKKEGSNLSTSGNTATMNLPAITINDIQKGLVAYWPLDNLSTTTPDLSGNRNHLQAINLTAADLVSGKKGNAISFNGINSLLLCFAAKGSGLPACSHPASTVAMWVKGSTANETGRVFSETTNARSPLVAISTDRRAPEGVVDLYMRADNDNTLVSHHRTSLVAFDNTWHHIAWVDNHGKALLYVDGIQDTSRINYTLEPITPTITALGGVMRFDTVRFAFQGLIDETAIWSRALTDAEIRLVMKKGLANFMPKTNNQSQNQIVAAKEQLNSATSSETVKDADGNIYHPVKIGSQVWTVENLKTTKFNDGTPIPNVIEAEEWKSITAPGYCYYENNPENGKKYGVLYNWYAASSDKIAPKGWRVPRYDEQIALMNYLIDNGHNYDGTTEENKIGKSMAAKTDWIYDPTNEVNETLQDVGAVGKNPETNNSSGFSALPTGSRWNDGSFHSIGQSVYWWSSTSVNGDDAHLSFIKTRDDNYGFIQHHKRSGFCIRLIRE